MEYNTLIRYLNLQGHERVLDVACGDGYWTSRLAYLAGEVVGFDFNRDRLKQAKRMNGGFFGLIGCDAHYLPFKDRQFDAAIGICVLEHFENDYQALSELRRVLKPGGKLVMTVDSFSLPDITEKDRARHAAKFTVYHWYRNGDLHDLLRKAGFDVVQSTYLLRSPLAASVYRRTLMSPKLSYLLYPFTYPLCLTSERFSRNTECGYKMAFSARAI